MITWLSFSLKIYRLSLISRLWDSWLKSHVTCGSFSFIFNLWNLKILTYYWWKFILRMVWEIVLIYLLPWAILEANLITKLSSNKFKFFIVVKSSRMYSTLPFPKLVYFLETRTCRWGEPSCSQGQGSGLCHPVGLRDWGSFGRSHKGRARNKKAERRTRHAGESRGWRSRGPRLCLRGRQRSHGGPQSKRMVSVRPAEMDSVVAAEEMVPRSKRVRSVWVGPSCPPPPAGRPCWMGLAREMGL